MKLDKYTRQYLETAIWSSTDDSGEPLDQSYSMDNLSTESIELAKKHVAAFLEKSGALLDAYDCETAMHDFWLTRNRHGAGFWNGLYDKVDGERLTEISHFFGEISLYVGDDGQLYFEGV